MYIFISSIKEIYIAPIKHTNTTLIHIRDNWQVWENTRVYTSQNLTWQDGIHIHQNTQTIHIYQHISIIMNIITKTECKHLYTYINVHAYKSS